MCTSRIRSIRVFLGVIVLALLPVAGFASEGSGLKHSIAADIVGKLGLKEAPVSDPTRDRITPREVELMFYAPIDHRFDGMVSGAAHFEAGEVYFELHEAYIKTSKLIPRSRVKLGSYFLGIGRLNRFHRHDWPFISAPKVHEDFLDEEGVQDTGLEYVWLTPLPFYLEVTLGMTSGFTFGHSHEAGSRPRTPTHYTRLGTYADLGDTGGIEIGLNYLGRKATDGEHMRLFGLDSTAKWKDGKVLRWLLQTEIWLRHLRSASNLLQKDLGGYFYPQYGFSENWALGIRFDMFNELTRTSAVTGQREKNINYGIIPTLSYTSSEFAKFRLAYGYHGERELSETQFTDHVIELQATFILGAHPAHEF